MVQPVWADNLIRDVLLAENRHRTPLIKWMKCGYGSSGLTHRASDWKSYYRKKGWVLFHPRLYAKKPDITIRIVEGAVEKGLLLHELSHWLCRSGHCHDKVFWEKAFGLYRKFLTTEEFEKYKQGEFRYKEKAKLAHDRMFGE